MTQKQWSSAGIRMLLCRITEHTIHMNFESYCIMYSGIMAPFLFAWHDLNLSPCQCNTVCLNSQKCLRSLQRYSHAQNKFVSWRLKWMPIIEKNATGGAIEPPASNTAHKKGIKQKRVFLNRLLSMFNTNILGSESRAGDSIYSTDLGCFSFGVFLYCNGVAFNSRGQWGKNSNADGQECKKKSCLYVIF